MLDTTNTPAPATPPAAAGALLPAARLGEIRAIFKLPRARNPYVSEYGLGLDLAEELLDHCDALAAALAAKEAEFSALRGQVTDLLADFANGCVPVSMAPGIKVTPYWLGVNKERENGRKWAELKCAELGLAWPIATIPYKGNLPAAPPVAAEAGSGEEYYPKNVFGSYAEYTASVEDAVRRIQSGEIQPREPQEDEEVGHG